MKDKTANTAVARASRASYMTQTKYIIMCRVSGGVTGLREAPFKKDGEIVLFTDRQEAEQLARSMQQERNENPHRTCHFRYWVEPEGGNS